MIHKKLDENNNPTYYHFQFSQGVIMTIQTTRRHTCRLCLSKDVVCVVKLNPVPLAEKYTQTPDEARTAPKYPIDLYMCQPCGHVQLLDVINSKELWSDYTYHSGQTQGIVRHFETVSKNIIARYAPAPGSLAIDIWSNDGTLLRFFKQAGYKVLGIDPAKEIAKKATESGIETICSTLTNEAAKKIRQKYGPASVVTAFNVYAHVDDLGDMTDGIRTLLSNDGLFVFEVQYLLDIVDHMLIGTIFHEHMSHHSLTPLTKFFDQRGLEMI